MRAVYAALEAQGTRSRPRHGLRQSLQFMSFLCSHDAKKHCSKSHQAFVLASLSLNVRVRCALFQRRAKVYAPKYRSQGSQFSKQRPGLLKIIGVIQPTVPSITGTCQCVPYATHMSFQENWMYYTSQVSRSHMEILFPRSQVSTLPDCRSRLSARPQLALAPMRKCPGLKQLAFFSFTACLAPSIYCRDSARDP